MVKITAEVDSLGDSGERPAGVEPALSPWQGDRLPLHHGRALVCRIVNEQEHREGLEPSSPHYECGILATGRPVQSVGPEGLEPSPGGLRVRCAAASTLIPINRHGGSRTLDLTLIRGLLSPLSYAPANRAGGTRTHTCRIKSPVCCRYTTTLCLVGRMRFHRTGSIFALLVSSGSPESRTQRYAVISRVWATSPRLPFANVVTCQVGMAGLEPASPCSQSTWVRRYPTSRCLSRNGRT